MTYLELFLIAVGLSMDAFAVSICKGLSVRQLKPHHAMIAGGYFGGFQALMPVIGWLLGRQFESLIKNIDHWIAFVLLALIGANMIREAVKNEEENLNDSFSPRTMLAVGVTFAFLDVEIVPAVSMIGVTTFVLSAVGVKIGNVFGAKYKSKAELVGGIVLVVMGVKILIEHLFFAD